MEVYDVGPDTSGVNDGDFSAEEYICVIEWYENYGYEGGGIAAAIRKDGFVEYKDLSHCSCYGPSENWASDCTRVSWMQFRKMDMYDDTIAGRLRTPADTDYAKWQAIVGKAKELKKQRKL